MISGRGFTHGLAVLAIWSAFLLGAAIEFPSAAAQPLEEDRLRLEKLDRILWSGSSAERFSTGYAVDVPNMRWEHPRPVAATAFAPNGQWVAIGARGETVLYDTHDGSTLQTWPMLDGAAAIAMEFSQDSQFLLTGDTAGTVFLHPTNGGPPPHRWGHQAALTAVALGAGDRMAASAARDSTVSLASLAEGGVVRSVAQPAPVNSLAFVLGGTRLLTAGADSQARFWDVESGTLLRALPHTAPVTHLAISPVGPYGVSGATDGSAQLLDLSNARALGIWQHPGEITGIAFSPDGRRVAVADGTGTITVHDLTTAGTAFSVAHPSRVTAAAYAPTGSYLVTGGADGTVRVWRAEDGGPVTQWSFQDPVTALAVSPDGRIVVAGTEAGIAQMHDLAPLFGVEATLAWLRRRAQSLLAYNLGLAKRTSASELPQWRLNQIAEYAFFSALGQPYVKEVRHVAESGRTVVIVASDSPVAPAFSYSTSVAGTLTADEAAALRRALPELEFALERGRVNIVGGRLQSNGKTWTLRPGRSVAPAEFTILDP